MSAAKICTHLIEQPDLEVTYVIDSHLHPTDGFARCRQCGAAYLFEMADIDGDLSIFRLSVVEPDAVAATVRSLTKGSCDLERARNEVFTLSNGSEELDQLLVMRSGEFVGLVPRPHGRKLARRSWRTLSCNGSLVEALGLNRR